MTKAGGAGKALILSTTCWSVTAASLFASPLNPTWVSLTCTKLKLPWLGSAAVAVSTRDERIPPEAVQTTPVPTQAMHSRKPRRSMRSIVCPPPVLVDDDRALHERMQVAGVGVHTR